jgi:biopolymer transport protein ExbB/TolQ
MLPLVLQAAPGSVPGWVGPTIAISLAIVAFTCVVVFAAIGLAALAFRRALKAAADRLAEMQKLVDRVRDEGDAYLATSRRLRKRLDQGIDRVSERAADLDALYEVVHEEVEETALRFASALRTARLSTGIIARALRRGRRR